MLEEGKITAAEAEALLNALSEGRRVGESEKQDDLWVRLEKQGEEFAERVESAAERFYRSLEGKTETLLGEKLAKLPKLLARFPFVGWEESHEFTQVFRGQLSQEVEIIPISLSTFNGSLQVKGWSEEGYQLTVKQRLRGKDRDVLRGRLYHIDWVEGETRDSLDLVIPLLEEATVSLQLMVPEKRRYSVGLAAHNGSLKMVGVRGTAIELETTNGSTLLWEVQGDSIKGQANNGSFELDQVVAGSVQHRLGNGSYRLHVAAADLNCTTTNGSVSLRFRPPQVGGSYQVRTTNGSISAQIPRLPELGLALDLKASVGRIVTKIDSLEFSRQERGGGGGQVVARTPNFAEQAQQVFLTASSSSGSISLRYAEESEG